MCSIFWLADTNVVLEGEDEICLPRSSCEQFTVKSCCEESFIRSSQLDFPTKAISKAKAPPKVCFLAWVATKGKVPIEDMVQRRNFKLASICSMRLEGEVSVDHLFIHC